MSVQSQFIAITPGTVFNDGTTTYTNTAWEGQEFEVEDYAAASGNTPAARRTGFVRRYRIVRNASGISLLPKYLVQFQATAGNYGKRIIGYNATLARKCYPVDDRLASTGAANERLFLICVGGPHLCYTHPVGDATNVINVGDKVVGESAAASTFSTTAGRVVPQVLTGATALLGDQVQNYVGHALTAMTTANTNTDVLVVIEHRWP